MKKKDKYKIKMFLYFFGISILLLGGPLILKWLVSLFVK